MTPTGLFETHLTVSDLDRSIRFYRDVVGLPLALHLPERAAAFFWIGGPGESMLGLWSLGSAPLGMTLHIALRASLADVMAACDALRAAGVTPLSFFGDETDEPSVIGWMPAAAVYFRDPDGHSIEYLSMLAEPPRPEAGIVPWSQWAPAAGFEISTHAGRREALRPLFAEAEDSERALDSYIDAGEVLVAVDGSGTLGHLQLIGDEINNMAVREDARGRGIGRALVAAALESARARRCGERARGHRRGGHRQPALLPALRLPAARGRARRVHPGRRVSRGDADRRDRAARPGLARPVSSSRVGRRRAPRSRRR